MKLLLYCFIVYGGGVCFGIGLRFVP